MAMATQIFQLKKPHTGQADHSLRKAIEAKTGTKAEAIVVVQGPWCSPRTWLKICFDLPCDMKQL